MCVKMILQDFITSVAPHQTIRVLIYYLSRPPVGYPHTVTPCNAQLALYADTELELKCLVNLSVAQLLITLAITLGYRTFDMPTEPSNRVVHMGDVLALETESWEICHSANCGIV
jgi:hypothetical protein